MMSDMKIVKRTEDMSTIGSLDLLLDDDGDIFVTVREYDNGHINASSVEFCIPGYGGGHSPKTYDALINLMNAMEEDNNGRYPNPSNDFPTDEKWCHS
jgi:hypothetical protein